MSALCGLHRSRYICIQAARYPFDSPGTRVTAPTSRTTSESFLRAFQVRQAHKHLDRAKRLFTASKTKPRIASRETPQCAAGQEKTPSPERSARCAATALGAAASKRCLPHADHARCFARAPQVFPIAHGALPAPNRSRKWRKGAGRASLI